MNRTTSTLLSLGVSAVLIAVGVWFLYNHNIGIWPEHHNWAMGHHGMMGGGMGIIMIIFWIVLIAAFVLLISGTINGIRGVKQSQDNTLTSLDILKQRYARGEIDTAEYEEKKTESIDLNKILSAQFWRCNMAINTNQHQNVDPVCQMKVTKSSKIPPFKFHSDTYYFCAEACRNAFISDPVKYLKVKPAKRKGWWGRYLDRLNKATGGKPPCCH